ncbi:RPM1 interacting protein 13-like [Prosopis cineraria]|uniref:RPM1 interacting protein 13-like n=1 Tax=Prosopis cineraria TaxID=364024 RepID=UPI00240F3610|nr:RPM1 interacting protein 13-like [Prosopis cineraria]
MGEIDRKPFLISSSNLKKPIETITLSSEEDDSPIRAMVCLRIDDVKRFEESEDCFVLEFDPFESVNLSKLSLEEKNPAEEDVSDLSIIAEKGQVACRDYPHSRHLCLRFPFNTKPHESYCEMCYCYVCDSAAPCKYWNSHCHAHNVDYWKDKRMMQKQMFSHR